MQRLLVVILMVGIISGFTLAQTGGKWEFSGTPVVGWAIATDEGLSAVNLLGFKNPYSVTLDPNGNIWCGAYYQRFYYGPDGTTQIWPDDIEKIVKTSQGQDSVVIVGTYPIFIHKTDGTFDSLTFLTKPDQTIDTLMTSGHRGMVTAPDGNIIIGYQGKSCLYKINYQTYEVMQKFVITTGSLARPAVDADGFVYHVPLLGGEVTILDPDDWSAPYNTIANVATGVSRSMAVSPDGKNAYFPCGVGVLHYYSSDGVDGTYALMDTLLKGRVINALVQWDPAGLLWAANVEEAAKRIMWAIDPDQDYAVVDSTSFIWWADTPKTDTTATGNYAKPFYLRAPRDAAFNADGSKMYIADMYGYTIKEYTFVTGIHETMMKVPGSFTLYNNYPNPFNPTTIIPFDLDKRANVRLKVYDSLGREIGTFIDQPMDAGSHQFEFNGSNLASGTYYFKLTVDAKVATGRMVLVK